MDEFLKDRKIEQETTAIVTYFKLLKQLELIKHEKIRTHQCVVFDLIGGMDTLRSLEIAISEGDFDYTKTNKELLKQLSDNLKYFSENWVSKNILTEQTIEQGSSIIMRDLVKISDTVIGQTAFKTLQFKLPYELSDEYTSKFWNANYSYKQKTLER